MKITLKRSRNALGMGAVGFGPRTQNAPRVTATWSKDLGRLVVITDGNLDAFEGLATLKAAQAKLDEITAAF